MAGSNGGSKFNNDYHTKGKKLIKFICLVKCVVSGTKIPLQIGDEILADVSDWKSHTWIELFDLEQSFIGYIKGHNVIPFAIWRDRQIDSILS